VTSKKIYFGNLDAIRSIACLMVLLSHILSEYLSEYYADAWWFDNPVTKFVLMNGGFGVQIFFTLSGFLITYLILREIQDTGHLNLSSFYIRRILRIWPVYFLVVAFVFIVYTGVKSLLGKNSPTHEQLWMSLLFLSNYDLIRILSTPGLYDNGMLSLTWSVSVEEQFYLFWPLIFASVAPRHFKSAILLVIITAIAFSAINQSDKILVYHHTVSNFLFLGTGALLGYLVAYEHRFLRHFAKWHRKHWILVFSIPLLVLVFAKNLALANEGGLVAYFIIEAIFLFLLFLNQVAKVQRPFELSQFSYLLPLAKYTYGLYMYHRIAGFIVGIAMYGMMGIRKDIVSDFVFVMANFLSAFMLAALSYKYVETYFLGVKARYSFLPINRAVSPRNPGY
jgi:peptidoglycan/LPS O-acetylase OafA/YrhL